MVSFCRNENIFGHIPYLNLEYIQKPYTPIDILQYILEYITPGEIIYLASTDELVKLMN